MNLIEGQGFPDFVMLDHDKVTEDGFVSNLKLRFTAKQIYSYIGEQLISMNPFQPMPQLYDEKTMKSYNAKYLYEVQPHIYALADDTFRALMQTNSDQCVIITGESGAGKTEASKVFMQYISKISSGGTKGEAEIIKQKLLDSNPVLESFGNAKTVRNDNSSRFGKYMEIQFDGAGAPIGGKISQYLLEKSRVVTRANGERTFHVFYMLLKQADVCKVYDLRPDPTDYEYLAISECFEIAHQNDQKEWFVMTKAMDTLGFTQTDKDVVWRVLAAILNIGNVEFVDAKKGQTDGSELKSDDELKLIAKHLKVELEPLRRVLTSRSITSGVSRRSSAITVPLTPKQAKVNIDSFAKALYNAVFTLVTQKLNTSIDAGDRKAEVVIGVLDIYGFEIFENNSFEQFCINYCNEKLQQIFIKLVLKAEQEEYVREGIEWKEIDYFNNAPIVDLIEGKTGIFKKLDEACMVGEVTPKQLLEKFDQDFGPNSYYDSYAKSKGKIVGESFQIKHYAGTVDYEIEEFADKNRDTLYLGIKKVLQASGDPLVRQFFPAEVDIANEKKRPPTAGIQFVQSVNQLINTLTQCQPHYIRCIKSNDLKKAFDFDEGRIRNQVRYLNLVETLRVRRAGFCNRQHYSHFMRRYKMLTPRTWPSWKGSDIDGTQIILDDIKTLPDEYRKGRTKLFVRDAKTLFKFERSRADRMPSVAVAIQRRWRSWGERLTFNRLQLAVTVQRLWRGYKSRQQYKKLRAAKNIQTAIRFRLAHEQYNREQAVAEIQAWFRAHISKTKVEEAKSARDVQAAFRAYRGRKFASNYKLRILRNASSTVIQKHARGYLARKFYEVNKERLRKEREEAIRKAKNQLAIYLQALWRQHQAGVDHRRRKAAVIIGKWWRRFRAKKRVKQLQAIVALETAWRSRLGRVHFHRVKSATFVEKYFQFYIRRRYVNRVANEIENQKKKDEKENYGKDTKLPSWNPAPLQPTSLVFKRLQHLWWARRKIGALSKDDNEALRQKVITYDLFHGKKGWDPARDFDGDYMDTKSNQNLDKYKSTIEMLFQGGGDSHIAFADAVIKVNRRGASQIQVVVVTNANIYKYKQGSFKMIKEKTPISAVKAIHLTKYPDTFVVAECDQHYRDFVLDLGTNGAERVSEFATVLYHARYLQGVKIPVTFEDPIVFNNSRTQKEPGQQITLKFEKNQKPDPKQNCKFVGPKSGSATVFYN